MRTLEVLSTLARWSISALPPAPPTWGHISHRSSPPLLLQSLQSAAWRNHNTSASPSGHPHSTTRTSIDPKEAAKFAQLANEWWRPTGPFSPLHRLNPTRCKFIRGAVCAMHGLEEAAREPFTGLRMLDVGCGGGILSESMARMGAQVHGIDITHENVHAAAAHAALDPLIRGRVRYECIPLESLVGHALRSTDTPADDTATPSGSPRSSSSSASPAPQYDVVLASEVLEHVRRPDTFVRHLAAALAPGGTLVLSTISRTPQAWAVAIVGAEYVTGIVPRGTHDWHRFLTPQELYLMASDAGLTLAHAAGMSLSPATGGFDLTDDLTINYIAAFHKT